MRRVLISILIFFLAVAIAGFQAGKKDFNESEGYIAELFKTASIRTEGDSVTLFIRHGQVNVYSFDVDKGKVSNEMTDAFFRLNDNTVADSVKAFAIDGQLLEGVFVGGLGGAVAFDFKQWQSKVKTAAKNASAGGRKKLAYIIFRLGSIVTGYGVGYWVAQNYYYDFDTQRAAKYLESDILWAKTGTRTVWRTLLVSIARRQLIASNNNSIKSISDTPIWKDGLDYFRENLASSDRNLTSDDFLYLINQIELLAPELSIEEMLDEKRYQETKDSLFTKIIIVVCVIAGLIYFTIEGHNYLKPKWYQWKYRNSNRKSKRQIREEKIRKALESQRPR